MSKSLLLIGTSVVGLVGLSPMAAAQLVFLPPSTLPTGPDASAAQVGDLDGDDVPDVVVMDGYTGVLEPKLREFLGHGDGSFRPVVRDVGLGAGFIRLADTNADGILDLVVSKTDVLPFFGVLPGDGAGGFLPYIGSDAGTLPQEFELARLDADDDLDAVVHNLGPPQQGLHVLMGDGFGGFVDRQSLPLNDPISSERVALAFGDFDENGWLDLAVGTGAGVSIHRGIGDGWLDSTALLVPCKSILWRIVVADFDADGHQDLALSVLDFHEGAEILLLRGHGDCSFDAPAALPFGWWFSGIATGDLDGDGDLDLLAIRAQDPDPNAVIAFVNAGDGTFAPGLELSTTVNLTGTVGTTDPLLADLDADTRPDLVLSVPWSPAGTMLVALDRSYLPGSPFADLGFALDGASGGPILLAEGSLTSTAQSTLSLWNGLGDAPLFAVTGDTAVFAPFRGGTLVPAPDFIVPLGTTLAAGPTVIAFRVPPGLSGLSLVVQFWLADSTAKKGFAATTGVRMQFP